MTVAVAPRPGIVVATMDPANELPYVLATAADALSESHGGRFARKDIVRKLVKDLVSRSVVEVASFADDPELILGFVARSPAPENVVELLYLRKSMSVMRMGRTEPLPVASEVMTALLGPLAMSRLVRLRRMPPQGWAWRVLHSCGYVPSVMPEGI